jgi:uncharacterized coiled-coil DUF342 family protein
MKDSLIRPDPGDFFTGQKLDGFLNFYGMVKDNDAAAVEGAVVVVFASFTGGTERLLGATITGKQGEYFICIQKLPDYNDLLGFKVRAGKAYILPEGIVSPDDSVTESQDMVSDFEEVPDDYTLTDEQPAGLLTEEDTKESATEDEIEQSQDTDTHIEEITTDECPLTDDQTEGMLTEETTDDSVTEDETDESNEVVPDIEEVTEESNEVVPDIEEVTEESNEVAPDIEEATDGYNEVVPDIEEVTDESNEVVPDIEEVTDESNEVVPVIEEAIDKSNEVVPDIEEVTDESNEVVPVIEEAIDKSNEVVPDIEEVTDERNEVVPDIEEVIDESNEVVPDIEEVIDESTIPLEEKGLAVSINEVDFDFIPVVVVPTVQTGAATDISMDSAILHGIINNTSGDYCTQRKFRIRVQGSESWSDAGIENGYFGPESFSFTITGLTPGTTYEYKAMAYNLAGWGEGSVTTFTAAVTRETPVEVKPAEVESSRKKSKQDKLPQKTPYDMYRSTYWRWLGGYKSDRRKTPKR